MRKLFWVSWCLLLLAFVASYFRTAAFDYQLTQTTWLQAVAADGTVRLVVLSGDPSASRTAKTVIERDQNTWRYDLSTAPWGRKSYWEAPVDTLGTLVRTYRVDVPLLGPLLIPLALMLAAWALKRWGAPPRLIWAELWTRPQSGRGAFGILRRVLLFVSAVLAFGAAFFWAGGYLDPMPRWSYFGDHFAFVTGGTSAAEFTVLFDSLEVGPEDLSERFEELIDQRINESGRPEKYFIIEIMRERIAFQYYTADAPSGGTALPAVHEFVGFEFRRNRVEMPSIGPPLPADFLRRAGGKLLPVMPRPWARTALERSLVFPLWALVIVFGLWPLLCFFRGPLRRARRRAAGCCPLCGYNLTGLIETRCPECGTEFDAKPLGRGANPTC